MQMTEMPATTNNCVVCTRYAKGLRKKPCYLHSPERAAERHRNTSRAAKSKTNAETKKLKAEIREVIAEIKAGTRDRNDATAIFQGYRVLKELIELERRIKETDQLAVGIAELKEQLESDHR